MIENILWFLVKINIILLLFAIVVRQIKKDYSGWRGRRGKQKDCE